MSLDTAPSFLISMLEIRGSRIFLNFLGGVQKNQECQESSVEEAAGAEENGQSCGLHPGWMCVSSSPSTAQFHRGSVPKYWETQKPALDVTESSDNNWKFEDFISPPSHCYKVIQTIL